MIDQRFIEDLAQDLVIARELEPVPEMQLASANTGVTTDGGAFVGYRLNMPKGLNTRENQAKQSVLIADTLAGGGKGAVQGFVGLPGDLESIGRMALGYLGYDVNENTVLPTSEEIGKRLESALGPVIPQGQTTGVPTEERVRAAEGGELGGEIIAPSGQIKLAGKVIKATKNLPVGMGIKAVDESLDPLGFYSAASKAVDNIQQPKGTGAQFLAQIEKTPGVKKEELLWTGLDEFLAGKKSVTKAEVQDYLNTNRVEVKETTLGDMSGRYKTMETELNKQGYELYVDDNNYFTIFKNDQPVEIYDLPQGLQKFVNDNAPDATETKFSKYTMPGGENYREVLLTLPEKTNGGQTLKNATQIINNSLREKGYPGLTAGEMDTLNRGGQDALDMLDDFKARLNVNINPEDVFVPNPSVYISGHFEEPNVLAHMRLNDRVDVDGKKVLFVEEIQSDWHQAGRKKGYKNPDAEKQVIDIEKRMADLANDRDPVTNQIVNERDFMALWKEKDELLKQTKGVPDAPFKTSWHELALKRAIQLASEGGYDRIAFTTGKTQAERYDLSKQISEVSLSGTNLVAYDKQGNAVIKQTGVTKDNLADYIGKEPAKKLLEQEPQGTLRTISGIDLQVGGEGMKGLYDTILPKYLDKYGKKWDAKVGMTEIPTSNVNLDNKIIFEDGKYLVDAGDGLNYNSYDTKAEAIKSLGGDNPSVHYMDITPKMKESVLTKGQPLFQMAPAIPAGVAAGQQEDNK
jgi:hypothetical protein